MIGVFRFFLGFW